MAAGDRRDLEVTRQTLEVWFGRQLGSEVVVKNLSVPKAGFSNETIVGTAAWTDPAQGVREQRFVLRIQPSHHQVFSEPDVMLQANVMLALDGRPGVAVPRVHFTETDPEVLGAPFFLMAHVEGRIPSDVPSWHKRGWTTELSPDGPARLYDNALQAMVALHAIDPGDDFPFLEQPGEGTALQRFVAHVQRWYDWSETSRQLWKPEVVVASMAYVANCLPDDDRAVVLWGDARVGNVIFAADLSVAAMLDWEGAVIGPPEFDLAWWNMFEELFTHAQGIPPLPGVPGPEQTIARYEQLTGRPVTDYAYHDVLSCLVFALINARLAELAIAGGTPPEVGTKFLQITIDMLSRRLDRAKG